MDGLTTVQCGAHLTLQILKSGTSFGKYLKRMLEPHEETRQERQRSVLPLPLKDDSWKEMKKVMESGEFKRLAGTWKEKQALGASKTKKEMRKVGLLIWHGLVTASLNFLWSGGRTLGQIARGKPSKAQLMCQERLWESVRVFVDDVSETTERSLLRPLTVETGTRGWRRWGSPIMEKWLRNLRVWRWSKSFLGYLRRGLEGKFLW